MSKLANIDYNYIEKAASVIARTAYCTDCEQNA